MPGRVVDEPRWQTAVQFAPAGFVENASAQTRPKHVEFGFAHGSLQAEQQPVVEVRGVVDAVFVQNEGVRQRADLQEPMPVGGITRQA